MENSDTIDNVPVNKETEDTINKSSNKKNSIIPDNNKISKPKGKGKENREKVDWATLVEEEERNYQEMTAEESSNSPEVIHSTIKRLPK